MKYCGQLQSSHSQSETADEGKNGLHKMLLGKLMILMEFKCV
jgi:hypothetical protein